MTANSENINPVPPFSPPDGSILESPEGSLGDHHVKDISKETKNLASRGWEGIKGLKEKATSAWGRMGKQERAFYVTAAVCLLIALLIMVILLAVFGWPIIPAAGALALLPWALGTYSLCVARQETKTRQQWEMPAYPKEASPSAEDKKAAEKLWNERNQYKKELMERKAEVIAALQRNVPSEKKNEAKRREREALISYENAEVAFWEKLDAEKALEWKELFNKQREQRGEASRFVVS